MTIHDDALVAFRRVYDTALEEKDTALASATATLAEHVATIALRDQTIQQRDALLASKDATIADRDQKLQVAATEATSLRGQITGLQAQIEALNARIAELEAGAPGYETPVAGITVTSWDRPANAIDANPSNINAVIPTVPAGGTLVLAGGTYTERWRFTNNPMTVQPAPGAKVVLDGQGAAGEAILAKVKVTIRGITFRNFNAVDPARWEHGLLFPTGSSGSVLEHCRFEDFKGTSGNFTRGAVVVTNRGSMTIRHCEFYRQDQGHISCNVTNGLVIENCIFSDSNLTAGSKDTSAGMKFTRAENLIFRNNYVEKLNAPVAAIWFDVFCIGAQVVNNVINTPGSYSYIFAELSADIIVANNRGFGGSKFAVWIFDSANVRCWNNDIDGGTSWQFGIMQDNRRNVNGESGDPRADGISRGNEAVNNIMGPNYDLFQVYAMDEYKVPYVPEYTAEQMWSRIEGNQMVKGTRGSQAGWGRLNRQRESLTLEQLEARYPQVVRNNLVTKPLPLPADIAAAMGVPAGTAQVGPILPAPVKR